MPTEPVPYRRIIHTFHNRDESKSADVHSYPLPYSEKTFWTRLRVFSFHANGIINTDGMQVQIILRTADGTRRILVSWRICPSTRWCTTRWAIPSLRLDESGQSGQSGQSSIWIEVKPYDSTGVYHIELQGYEGMYPESDRYLLIDELDHRQFLFQQEKPVSDKPVGSIHDVYGKRVHGDPLEAECILLFPIWTDTHLDGQTSL